MRTNTEPEIGKWYSARENDAFEVVAIDLDLDAVEIQHFDGAVEEYDIDAWHEMEIHRVAAPEDWSGSLDVTGDDYGVDLDIAAGNPPINPMDDIDRKP